MDNKLLLVKSITLLYRESQLAVKGDSSADLIRTAIETIKIPDVGVGINTEREMLAGLKATLTEMCDHPADYEYDLKTMLTQLKLNCSYDEKLYEVFVSGIEDELPEPQLKRTIVNLRKAIQNHFREQKIDEVLNQASYRFKYKRDAIKDVNQFVMEVLAQLEPLQTLTTAKDPAVVGDIDIGDESGVRVICDEIKEADSDDGLIKFGWQGLNEMIQGGARRGDTVIIPALQHKYKTGFSLSLFMQAALYNKPYMLDPTKKPLLVRFSFEDDLKNNIQFMYQKLKYDETKTFVDVKSVTSEEMSAYIKQRLQVNGYHIKMLRVDPTQWSYRHICNKIIELEAQGYEIHLCMVDYIGMLPTTGCNVSGPIGTDKRDLIRRLRNFFGPKKITFMTPYQLSTEAKMLIRNGLPEDKFVKDVAEKGYYDGCKALDQEVDLEIFIHLFKHNGETYLAVQRGKHRLPNIVEEKYKYFLMKFPKRMPIPDDLMGESIALRKLPSASSNADESLFSF